MVQATIFSLPSYLGILLFDAFLHQHNNKSSHQNTNRLYGVEFGMPILGLMLQSAFALIAIACLVTLIMISFNLKRI